MQKKNSFTYEELLACGRGEMFGAGNAQLPLPPMLMFDRIVSITDEGGKYGQGQIIAELDVKPDLWFFGCHFQGDPVMPGCLGLDALWQLCGFFLGWLGAEGRGRREDAVEQVPDEQKLRAGETFFRIVAGVLQAVAAMDDHRLWVGDACDGSIIELTN